MRRLVIASTLSAVAGAALATGVMMWEPWGDDLDAAKCEAAIKSFQEARDLYSNANGSGKDSLTDLLGSAGRRWEKECHLEPIRSGD